MAILLTSDSGWIISHLNFFQSIKVNEMSIDTKKLANDTVPRYLSLNPDLFEITEPFRDKVKGKLVTSCSNIPICDTAKIVKYLFHEFLKESQWQKLFEVDKPAGNTNGLTDGNNDNVRTKNDDTNSKIGDDTSWPKNNFKAVRACQQFFDTVKSLELPRFLGENSLKDSAVISTLTESSKVEHRFVFPAETRFYCNEVENMEKVFQENDETGFDVIVLDPPWRNKFIRRKKRKQHEAGYEMIDDNGISDLPIKHILNEDGIIVVWCTNAKSHQDKLINEIFPRWDVRHLKTLYWLKVTTSGVPICPFNVENKKQPYEAIIIGKKDNCAKLLVGNSEFPAADQPKIVISVPSSINSHKPPLINVIRQMYPDKEFHRKLEIFARYLTPGFVSYGNEVVKLQHESLYV